MMKKTKISLWKWALGICMLFAGVQGAWAQNQKCSGTAYIKPPASWTSVYVSGQNGKATKATFNSVSGYYSVDLAAAGADDAGFGVGDKIAPNQTTKDTLHYLDSTGVGADLYDANKLQNPEYIARYAREKYLYSKEGEYILQIPEE